MIDGLTGEVIWRLGRSNLSDDEWRAKGLKPPLKIVGDHYGEFCGQHSAKILGSGNLIVYDNGVHCLRDPDTGDTARTSGEFTRVVEYALDVDSGEAVFVRHHSYNDSFNAVIGSAGLVAPISNGNWLISWGRTAMDLPAVTEWDPVTNTELLRISYTTSAGDRAMTRAYPMRYDEFPARGGSAVGGLRRQRLRRRGLHGHVGLAAVGGGVQPAGGRFLRPTRRR